MQHYEPVLISSSSSLAAAQGEAAVAALGPAPATAGYYTAQLDLHLQPERFLQQQQQQLEVTCVSRVGRHHSRGSGGPVEGRAKWVVPYQHQGRHSTPVPPATSSAVAMTGGGGNSSSSKSGGNSNISTVVVGLQQWPVKLEEDDDEDDDGQSDDRKANSSATRTRSASAQSGADNPSRRTQPVVGSYPGKTIAILSSESIEVTRHSVALYSTRGEILL